MNLKFICRDGFGMAEEICARFREYLPALIHGAEIIRTDAFRTAFDVQDILPRAEVIGRPDWERDIVLVVVEGPVYLADLELYEAAATLDYLVQQDGRIRARSARPKIGVRFMPHNMPPELRGDAQFWAKVGAEEILPYFGVPEGHDPACFFHPEGRRCLTVEDARKDYCPKCREFMGRLESPLDVARICSEVEEIYGLASARTAERGKPVLRGIVDRIRGRR